jgi:hypothetical protein
LLGGLVAVFATKSREHCVHLTRESRFSGGILKAVPQFGQKTWVLPSREPRGERGLSVDRREAEERRVATALDP